MRKRSSSGFHIEKVPNLKSEVMKLLKIMSKHYKNCSGVRDDLTRVNGSQLLSEFMDFQNK
jgi:hypothetical protein